MATERTGGVPPEHPPAQPTGLGDAAHRIDDHSPQSTEVIQVSGRSGLATSHRHNPEHLALLIAHGMDRNICVPVGSISDHGRRIHIPERVHLSPSSDGTPPCRPRPPDRQPPAAAIRGTGVRIAPVARGPPSRKPEVTA